MTFVDIYDQKYQYQKCVPMNKMVFLSFELESGETLLTKYIVPFEFKVFILNFRIEFLVEKMKISLSY